MSPLRKPPDHLSPPRSALHHWALGLFLVPVLIFFGGLAVDTIVGGWFGVLAAYWCWPPAAVLAFLAGRRTRAMRARLNIETHEKGISSAARSYLLASLLVMSPILLYPLYAPATKSLAVAAGFSSIASLTNWLIWGLAWAAAGWKILEASNQMPCAHRKWAHRFAITASCLLSIIYVASLAFVSLNSVS